MGSQTKIQEETLFLSLSLHVYACESEIQQGIFINNISPQYERDTHRTTTDAHKLSHAPTHPITGHMECYA